MVIDLENYIGEESSFGSRYEVQPINSSQLPEGVVEALDTQTGATVHIKCLDDLSNYESLDDFINQAKNVSVLNHPNLLRVLDFGTNSRVNGLIVFERIHCKNLRSIIKESGAFKIEDAINVIKQLVSCLEFIHTRDYLHGSLSLLDIHVDLSVESKPLAKISGLLDTYPNHGDDYDTEDLFTQTFFSPEQITTDDYDSRSDVFALGCLMYSIITGNNIDLRAAYNATTREEILAVVEHEAIPIPLENIIVKCLDRDLENRFQTCTEILGGLGAVERFIPTTSKKRRESLESPRQPKKPDPDGIGQLLDKNETINNMVSDQIDSITLFGSGAENKTTAEEKPELSDNDSDVDFSDLDFPFEDNQSDEDPPETSPFIESNERDQVLEVTDEVTSTSSTDSKDEIDMEMDFSDLDFPMDFDSESVPQETEELSDAVSEPEVQVESETPATESNNQNQSTSLDSSETKEQPEDITVDFSDLDFPGEIQATEEIAESKSETFDQYDGFTALENDTPDEKIGATINDALDELDVSQSFANDPHFKQDVTENKSFDIESSIASPSTSESPDTVAEVTPLQQQPQLSSESDFDLEIVSLSDFENDLENIEPVVVKTPPLSSKELEPAKEEVVSEEIPVEIPIIDKTVLDDSQPVEQEQVFFNEPAALEQPVIDEPVLDDSHPVPQEQVFFDEPAALEQPVIDEPVLDDSQPVEQEQVFFNEPAALEQPVIDEPVLDSSATLGEDESTFDQTASQNEFFPDDDLSTDSSTVQNVSDTVPEQLVEDLAELEIPADRLEESSETQEESTITNQLYEELKEEETDKDVTSDRLDQLISTVNNTIPITVNKKTDRQTRENFQITNDTIKDIIQESKQTDITTPSVAPTEEQSDLIAGAAAEIENQLEQAFFQPVSQEQKEQIPESEKTELEGNFIESSLDDIRESLNEPEVESSESIPAAGTEENLVAENKKVETFDSKDFSDFKSLDFDDMASSTADSLGMKRLAEQLKSPKSKDNSLRPKSYTESNRFSDLENLLDEKRKKTRKRNPFEKNKDETSTEQKSDDLNFGPIEQIQEQSKNFLDTQPEETQEPDNKPKKLTTKSTLDDADERMVTLSGSYFTLPTLSTLIEKQNLEEKEKAEELKTSESDESLDLEKSPKEEAPELEDQPTDIVPDNREEKAETAEAAEVEAALNVETETQKDDINTNMEDPASAAVEPGFASIEDQAVEEEIVDDSEVTRTLMDTDPIIIDSPDNAPLTSSVDIDPSSSDSTVFEPIESKIEPEVEPESPDISAEIEEEDDDDGGFTETLLEAKPIVIDQPDYSPLTEKPEPVPQEEPSVSPAPVEELHDLVNAYRAPDKTEEKEEEPATTTNGVELAVPKEIEEMADSIGIVKKDLPVKPAPVQEESVLQKAKRKVTSTLIGAAAIKNNYEKVSKIGESDLYSIYTVKETITEKIAIAKCLETTEPAVTMEFVRKANQHATLLHSNILRSIGSLDTSLGRPYFIMDHMKSVTLESLLASIDRIESPKEFYDIFSQVLNAVEYSHNKNIMHGSLRPSNIMLLEVEGQVVVKVLDFDMWSVRQMYHVVTGTASPANRALYMSPEQFTQSDPTPQSDVYQLGILCIKMLTGKEPVEGNSYKEIMSKMLNENREAIDLVEARPDIENIEDLDKVIKVATYFEENNRFQSVTDFKNAINNWWRNYQFAHHAEKQAKNTNLRAMLQDQTVLRETELHQTETAMMKFTTFASTGPRQSPVKTMINYFIGLGIFIGLVCFTIINYDTLLENFNAISLQVGEMIHKEKPQEPEQPVITDQADPKSKTKKKATGAKTAKTKATKSKTKRPAEDLKAIRSRQIKTERNRTTVPFENKLYAPADEEITIPKNKRQRVYPYLYTEKQFKKWKEVRHFRDRPQRDSTHDSKIKKVKSK